MESKTSYMSSLCGIYSFLQVQYVESKTSYMSSLCGICGFLQEQCVESKTSFSSSLWTLRPLTGAVCGI